MPACRRTFERKQINNNPRDTSRHVDFRLHRHLHERVRVVHNSDELVSPQNSHQAAVSTTLNFREEISQFVVVDRAERRSGQRRRVLSDQRGGSRILALSTTAALQIHFTTASVTGTRKGISGQVPRIGTLNNRTETEGLVTHLHRVEDGAWLVGT